MTVLTKGIGRTHFVVGFRIGMDAPGPTPLVTGMMLWQLAGIVEGPTDRLNDKMITRALLYEKIFNQM